MAEATVRNMFSLVMIPPPQNLLLTWRPLASWGKILQPGVVVLDWSLIPLDPDGTPPRRVPILGLEWFWGQIWTWTLDPKWKIRWSGGGLKLQQSSSIPKVGAKQYNYSQFLRSDPSTLEAMDANVPSYIISSLRTVPGSETVGASVERSVRVFWCARG